MLQQVTDFHAEGAELRELLLTLRDSDWDRKTLFKDWTVNDVVLHLHSGDLNARRRRCAIPPSMRRCAEMISGGAQGWDVVDR